MPLNPPLAIPELVAPLTVQTGHEVDRRAPTTKGDAGDVEHAALLYDQARALRLIKAYASAVRDAGRDPGGWAKVRKITPSSTRWSRLIAAADALSDHELAPENWATWYVTRFAVKQFASGRTPSLPQVFALSTIAKRAGWCRKETDGSGTQIIADPVALESMYRRLEAYALNRGESQANALRVGPPEYFDKRMAEILAGHDDPNDFAPRRR